MVDNTEWLPIVTDNDTALAQHSDWMIKYETLVDDI